MGVGRPASEPLLDSNPLARSRPRASSARRNSRLFGGGLLRRLGLVGGGRFGLLGLRRRSLLGLHRGGLLRLGGTRLRRLRSGGRGALARARQRAVQVEQPRQRVLTDPRCIARVLRALGELDDRRDELVARAEALLGLSEQGVEAKELRVGYLGETFAGPHAIDPQVLRGELLDG